MTTANGAAVVFQPRAGAAVQRGTRALTALLRPTIGPHPRAVASATTGLRPPELLDDGGLIARRLIQLPGRDEDVGAMFLRGLLRRVHQEAGDGVATTSVLFQAVFDGGLRAIAAGGDETRLRHHLHTGLRVILDQLASLTAPVVDETTLRHAARTLCADPELAEHLAGIFTVLGEHGQVELRSGQSRGLASELIDGSYWETAVLTTAPLADRRRLDLERAVIVISDLELEQPHDLVPLLRLAREQEAGGLVVIVRKLTDSCGAVLAANSGPDFRAIAVRTPGIGPPDRHATALADLEALTGGRAFRADAGDQISRIGAADLGWARRAWVDRHHVGVVSPGGDPSRLRAHVRALRRQHREADDAETRTELSQRIARLAGATALLWVGGATAPAIEARKAVARRAITALRGAVQGGVVPGAGAALLTSRTPLAARLATATEPEERAAYGLLLRAVEEPARAIIANSGHDPGRALAAIERAGAGYGFDVESGRVVAVAAAGLVDAALVTRTAVRAAVEGAAQALTIGAVVHARTPAEARTP